MVWSLGSVCSVSLCPFLSLSLSVRLSVGGETRIKQLPKTAQKVKTQPNGFARKRNKTTQRNEMSKLRFQVLATVGLLLLLLLPSPFHCQPHPQAPHNRTPAYTHTHTAWWPVCCLGNAFLFAIFCNLFAKPLWLLKFLTHAAYFWGPVAGTDRVARVMLLHGNAA